MSVNKRIIFFHLLNDYSGSPKVLMQSIEALNHSSYQKHVFSTFKQEGFLNHCTNVEKHHMAYHYFSNAFLRLFAYSYTQVLCFFKALFFLKKTDWVYVNTLLPFGAALAAKIKGSRITYHLHESSIQPKILHHFLCAIAKKTASETIYVSHYVKDALKLNHHNEKIIYNAIEQNFLDQAEHNQSHKKTRDVLLIASLKEYKGILDFKQLSIQLPQYKFCMVLNATEQEVKQYFKSQTIPENLEILSRKSDLHPYFSSSRLVVNLSHPDRWIETFGLTILEGMAYGLPAIVPPVGGVMEVVNPNKSAFCTSVYETEKIKNQIISLLEDPELYQSFSGAASEKLKDFLPEKFNEAILRLA